jgi:predicted nucleotidyltransferase
MTAHPLTLIHRERLSQICRRYRVRRLALYGSVLSEENWPSGGVDVLVEFAPENVPGYLRLSRLERELAQLFDGRPVEAVTAAMLPAAVRERILAEAVSHYAEA